MLICLDKIVMISEPLLAVGENWEDILSDAMTVEEYWDRVEHHLVCVDIDVNEDNEDEYDVVEKRVLSILWEHVKYGGRIPKVIDVGGTKYFLRIRKKVIRGEIKEGEIVDELLRKKLIRMSRIV